MPVEVEPVERPEQRLGRDEAHGRRHLAQVVGAMHEAAVLDRSRPSRRSVGHGSVGRELGQALVALREDLEGVLVGLAP